MKKHSNAPTKREPRSRWVKSRGPVQRDTKEVLAELVGKLSQGQEPKVGAADGEEHQQSRLRPDLGRLTVGVDLGDKWSAYCILGLEGQTLAEGQLRTTKQHVGEFFRALDTARVVLEVGTHSAWMREIICGYGHEVLVANPRLMDGPKRRKRKNDRIDANKLARLGRVDPQSLYPIEHRSTEVRQDLVMLRARDALVAARTQIINVTRGLVKSLGTQLPKCSSPSFAQKVEETVPAEIREAVLPLVRLTVVEFGNPLYQDVVDSYVLEGKGLSQVGVKQIEAAQKVFPVSTVQNLYNLANRADEAVLTYCEANGIGFIPWFPLAAGDLTRPGGGVEALAKPKSAAPSQIVLAWMLKRSPAMLPIAGTSRVAHLEENVAAAAIQLTDDEFAQIDAASPAPQHL